MLDAVRTETRAAGIHAVYSPVVDVNNNPDNPIICTRAFGDEPGVVEWFGARYIARLQKSSGKNRVSLLACAKHFPGHGDTDQDSHSVLPVIRADRPRLNSVELPPFREAVKDGVGMVMVAHLLVPALDPEKPTTFSKKTVTALLREGMEFNGLIVSDALDMGALANDHSQEEIAVRAVEAGMDILLHPKDAEETIKFVLSAVETGRLTEQRITESLERIMEAKKRLGLIDGGKEKAKAIDYEKHRAIARELARKAPRILRARERTLPFDINKGVACFILDDDAVQHTGEALLAELSSRFAESSVTVLTPQSLLHAEHMHEKVSGARGTVIALFSRISASKGRSGMAESLRDTGIAITKAAKSAGRPVIVVSFDSPYILDQFTGADVLIAAYDRMDEIQQAVAEMIAGK
jgi:beta-N-acetylhexosaminidase